MSNYNSLKATIDANIKQNGNQEITGQILNSVLNQMVTTLGAGYLFAGVATLDPATEPGTPDAKVFYIANGKGTYTNFGGINVTEDDVVVLYWDSSWHKVSTGIASQAKLSELDKAINDTMDKGTEQVVTTIVTSWESGYCIPSGIIEYSTSYVYSNKISVKAGDIIHKTNNQFRYVTAYNNGIAQEEKGDSKVDTYVVPEGIDEIVISLDASSSVVRDDISLTRTVVKYTISFEEEFTKVNNEVFGYSKTQTINSNSWSVYFEDLAISIGQKLRFKINTQNPFTRVIIGTYSNRIYDSLPPNDTWVEIESPVNVLGVQLFVEFADGVSAPVTLSIQTGLSILPKEVSELETDTAERFSDIEHTIGFEKNGTLAEADVQRIVIDDILIKQGEKFQIKISSENLPSRLIIFYSDSNADRLYDGNGLDLLEWKEFVAPADIRLICLWLNESAQVTLYAKYDGQLSNKNYIIRVPNKNLADITKSVVGYIYNNGNIEPNTNYRTTDFIAIKNGESYAVSPRLKMICFFDSTRQADVDKYHYGDTANYVFTAPYDGYVRVSYEKELEARFMVEKGATITKYVPFGVNIEENIHISETIKEDIDGMCGSVLYRKKYVACGDSFTEGDFTGYVDQDGHTGKESDAYDKQMGCYKTYPYYIAKHNDMLLINEAISGSCLANDGSDSYFAKMRYQAIPTDADYITIKFGINDSHQNIPIGTIDDTTDTTFYGAWNKVLSWLCVNRPNAKIGIIATNGADSVNYSNATVLVAKKYGISCINEEGDEVPFFFRQTFKSVPNDVRTAKEAIFRVTETNYHPNIKCHKYEYSIIESWMKTL